MGGGSFRPVLKRLAVLATLALFVSGCNEGLRAERLADEGLDLARRGSYAEALTRFESALEIDPSNQKAAYNRGLVFLATGAFARAEEVFGQFANANPSDSLAWFEKARAEILQNKREQAILSLQRAIDAGFTAYDRLVADGLFAPLYSDFRFVAMEMTVAQRAGVEAKAGVLGQAPGLLPGAGPGNYRLPPMNLPGVGGACAMAKADGREADGACEVPE